MGHHGHRLFIINAFKHITVTLNSVPLYYMQEKPTVNPSLRSLNRTDEPLLKHEFTPSSHLSEGEATAPWLHKRDKCHPAPWRVLQLVSKWPLCVGTKCPLPSSWGRPGPGSTSPGPRHEVRELGMGEPSDVPSTANALPQCSGSCGQDTHLSVQLDGHLLTCSLSLPRSLSIALFGTHGV